MAETDPAEALQILPPPSPPAAACGDSVMRKALLPALVPAKRVAERAAAVAPVARQCGCALGAAGLAAWEGGGAGALIRPCFDKILPATD